MAPSTPAASSTGRPGRRPGPWATRGYHLHPARGRWRQPARHRLAAGRHARRRRLEPPPAPIPPRTCAAPSACGKHQPARTPAWTKGGARMPIDCCRARETQPCCPPCLLTLSATCQATIGLRVAAQRPLRNRASSHRILARTATGLSGGGCFSPFQPTAGFRTFPRLRGLVCLRFSSLWRFTMNTSNEKSYFDIHTSGIGYLQRAREVPVKGGRRAQPFLSCSSAALVGPVDEPEYRYFDTIVGTPEAAHLVRRCVQAIEGDRKVLIGFRLNDMKIDPYIRTKGEYAGEPAASLESTLVHIGLIKIDGTKVYPTNQAQAEAPPTQDAPAPEAASAKDAAADTAADQPSPPAEREPEGEVQEQEPALAASF